MTLNAIAAFGTAMLCVGAAHAGPGEEVADLLDEQGPGLAYETVEMSNGGVVVRGMTATAAFMDGLAAPDAGDPATSPTALRIASLELSEGVVALLLGTSSGAEQGRLEVAVEGYHLDLATMAGSHEIDLLISYLGADEIEGTIQLSVEGPPMGRQILDAELDLDPIGHIELRLEFDNLSFQLASGELRLTDTPEHGFLAVGAYLERLWLEDALDWAERSAAAGYAEAADAETVAEMRETLAAMPSNGPEAAAQLAAWAGRMIAALPEHRAVLEPISAFFAGPGTLLLTYAPPDPTADPVEEVGNWPGELPTAEQLAQTLERLGISAEFEPAE